ncbi:DUF4139 domain-containing protein [Algisphaera agarilytica]|uniref:DUF4139 domain-containing protein n=1 Tax=Algisphaera agarilytica TaxID=1385975 RepID=A0A7X0H3I3_9BACT|nr:DUF4139 domain-containing protein [Algisphaera agarilytica]MBB6428539.1 hypothetical protein [Algisphaera agarilytica]
MKYFVLFLVFLGLLGTLGDSTASGKNIDLSTVPDRDTVQLTIYNSADLTLVRETRKVVFKPGNNPLQFSWANTLIDPTSVQLRFLNHAEKLDVLDTTFPHDRPQVLVWNVGSEHAGEAVIEISYFTSGVSWSADYTVIANADESAASVEGFVTVVNNSGEDYEDAQVRLVVGTINLVEQIAELARRSGRDVSRLDREEVDAFKLRAARQNVVAAEAAMADPYGGGGYAGTPKQIVKQGLSEYFIFTIEGTEDIPTNSRKRLPSFAADAAPLEVQYRYRPQQYGERLVRLFLMTNDTESEMGTSPLPDGQVRVFRQKEDGRGLSFLARQQVKYIPIGDDLELNLGVDPNVGFELITQRTFRDNLWMRQQGIKVLTRVDQPGVQIKDKSSVAGWDQHQVMARRVRNDTPRPIDVEIRQAVYGDATFTSRLDATRYDNHNVVFGGTLQPGERYDAVYQVSTRQGANSKQNRVEIVDDDPAALNIFAGPVE